MISFFTHIDHLLFQFINQTIANPFFDLVCPVLRDARTWIPLYILLGIYLVKVYRKETWIYVFYILIAFSLADSVSYQILKPFFERLRPCHDPIMHARVLLDNCGGQWGFPSNHAANHMSIALSIVLCGIFKTKWANAAWIIWALLIGFSQVYVGVHYPGDIAGGLLFGCMIAVFNYKFVLPALNKLHRRITGNNLVV